MNRTLPLLLALFPLLAGCQPSGRVSNLVALFTDFGSSDPYVAQLKGAIKTISPSAEIMDLSHENGAFDISSASYLLAKSARTLPPGTIIVARDSAHAKLKEILEETGELPEYFRKYPVYYAGPAKTPVGLPSGSFGPTTAGRMDGYVDLFQSHGGSMVMLAKGNRSKQVTDACQKYGGFYLGSAGGPAALLAQDHIRSQEIIDFPELGMEAVWKITVENFPAFILVDNKGHDFFTSINICPVCR